MNKELIFLGFLIGFILITGFIQFSVEGFWFQEKPSAFELCLNECSLNEINCFNSCNKLQYKKGYGENK